MLRSSSRLALVFLIVGCAALLPYLHQLNAGLNDEGSMIASAERVLRGQVPYRDFDMFYPPGTTLVTAAWMGLLGETVTSWRILMVVGAGLMAMLVWLFADELLERPWSLLPPLLFVASGVSEWPLVSYHWMAIAALVATAWLLLRWMRAGGDALLLACGMAAGWAGACLQTEGAAAVLGVAAGLAFARRFTPRRAGVAAAGVALVWIPLLAWMAVCHGLPDLARDLVGNVLSGLYRYRSSPYSLAHLTQAWAAVAANWPASWGWPQLAWALQAIPMALLWTFKYGLLFPILAAGAWVAWRRGPEGKVMAVMGVAWLFAKHDRLDMLYANYLTPMEYAAVALVLAALPTRAARAMAVAVLVLFAVNLGVAQVQAAQHRYPVRTPAGTLYADDPQLASAYQALYSFAATHTPPGTPAFAFPFAAAFAPLSRTVNPARIDFVLPGQHSEAQIEAAAAAVRAAGTPYVYFIPLSPNLFADYPAYDPKRFWREMGAITRRMVQGCRRVGEVGPAIVYRRMGATP